MEVKNGTALDAFVSGANKGFKISTTSMMPNVMMAFAIIQILNVTGLLNVIEVIFAPLMGIAGLPGVGAAVYLAALLSGVGASGMAASLYLSGELTAAQCVILFPGIVLMTGSVQYFGRILGATNMETKYYAICFILNMVIGFLAMFIMNIML